ncbi:MULTISPECIES: DUF2306 domain-containing protein [unclassified Moraxella]|uniref:DUF2306 domain-containing protein n=1 Tax=unclassified Moraxella TaxID=2685852 RepID=UPI003AF6FA0A
MRLPFFATTPKKSILAPVFTGMALICLAYFCWLMGQIVWGYRTLDPMNDFLILKQFWVKFDWWRWAFWTHVFSSGLVLLAGFSQFWQGFGSLDYRKWHKYLGYFYVITVLGLALPSGFVLAWTALGGWLVKGSFLTLCGLWGYTTIMAVVTVRKRQIARHRTLMVYSYALAMSAITLRLLKLGLYQLAPYVDWLTPMTIYRTESVLAWVINLAIAWLFLKLTGNGK